VVRSRPSSYAQAASPQNIPRRDSSEGIQEYDRRIEKMAQQTYPETALLKQVKGVGDIIATAYMLTIEDPHRFPLSDSTSRNSGSNAWRNPVLNPPALSRLNCCVPHLSIRSP